MQAVLRIGQGLPAIGESVDQRGACARVRVTGPERLVHGSPHSARGTLDVHRRATPRVGSGPPRGEHLSRPQARQRARLVAGRSGGVGRPRRERFHHRTDLRGLVVPLLQVEQCQLGVRAATRRPVASGHARQDRGRRRAHQAVADAQVRIQPGQRAIGSHREQPDREPCHVHGPRVHVDAVEALLRDAARQRLAFVLRHVERTASTLADPGRLHGGDQVPQGTREERAASHRRVEDAQAEDLA